MSPNGQRLKKSKDEVQVNRQIPHDDNEKGFEIKEVLYYIIPVIIITFLIVFFFKGCLNKKPLSYDAKTTTKVVEQPVAQHIVDNEVGHPDNGNPVISEASESGNVEEIDFKKLTIDVAEFTDGVKYMTKNSAYTIRIFNKHTHKPVEDIKGSWKIQDSDFYIGNPNSAETTITPIRSGPKLKISFYVEGYETPLIRTIECKKENSV